MPRGTVFRKTVNGDYFAKKRGEIIDAWHITGTLIIQAGDIAITNSQIDGTVGNEYGNVVSGPFTITDSTVGPEAGCVTAPGVGESDYTAVRVRIRGCDDGFRASGPNITIRDSYVKNCGQESSHGDGIQDYPAAQHLVFDHNTIDMCGDWTLDRAKPCDVTGHNSPIFINSNPANGAEWGSTDVTITRNLVMGGVYSLYLYPAHGTWVVTGNRVVNETWDYGAYENNGACDHVTTWSDNTVVTMNEDYDVTSTVRTEECK